MTFSSYAAPTSLIVVMAVFVQTIFIFLVRPSSLNCLIAAVWSAPRLFMTRTSGFAAMILVK